MFDSAHRLRRWTLYRLSVTVLMLAAVSPGGVLAQTADDYRARLDTLLSLWHQAVEAESETRPHIDTLAVGALRLHVWPQNREIVRDAAVLAMAALREHLAADTVLLARLPIFIEFAGDPAARRNLDALGIHLASEMRADRERLANLLVDRISEALAGELDEELDAWLGQRMLLGAPFSLEKRAVYIHLATADSRAARRCLEGRIRACRDALAVDELADPVSVWYAPEERRRLVARRAWWRDGARTLARACTDDRSDEACLELLRSLPANSLWPLPVSSHRLLLRIAVDRGGPHAYTRLLESEGPTIVERLSEVAEIEPDSLVTLWRSEVMSARLEARLVSTSVAFGGLAWTLVFFTVALRSRRWRWD